MRALRSADSCNARCTAGTNRSGRSFDRKSIAPARSAVTASSSFGVPDTTMHGSSRAATIFTARSPPKPGITQSLITRSHGCCTAAASAATVSTRVALSSYPPRRSSRSKMS